MDAKRYTLTVYAAAPGTPIREAGVQSPDGWARSVPGHMYYAISDGGEPLSWGFAPKVHGSLNGPGEVAMGDADKYVDPIYKRTMEISKDQFDRLNEFGNDPARYGFDMSYRDIRNNCVDFTWAALNHAGIQRTHGHIGHLQPHGVDGKLSYLPALAPNDIRTIKDPFPGSDLNHEERKASPTREWWQSPLANSPQHLETIERDPFERLYAATIANDDKAFDRVAQDYLQSADGLAFLASGREFNQQQEQAQAQAQAEQAQAQAQAPAAPAMQMSM